MYGDQEKYYRQLYGRRKLNNNTSFFNLDNDIKRPGAQITELTDDFFENNTQDNIEPAPDEAQTFGVETEPIYNFDYQNTWQRDQRRQPLQHNFDEYVNTTDLDKILLSTDSIRSMIENGLPLNEEVIDSKEEVIKNGDVIGKNSRLISKTKKGAIITEETEISTDFKTQANLKFQRSTVKSGPNRTKEVLQPVKEDKVLSDCLRTRCLGDQLTTTTTTLVTVAQTTVTCCNE